MGAVTPTARPPGFPALQTLRLAAGSLPPGVMTRRGPDPIPPTDGKASAGPTTWHGRLRHLRTPAVIQATSAGTPEPGQTAAGSRRDPQTPADFLRDARRPTAMRAHAEMSKFNAAEYLCGGWHSHSSFRQCSRVGMAIAAPLWSCTRNEACRLWAGLSMVDSRRVPVQDNSIVGASAAR